MRLGVVEILIISVVCCMFAALLIGGIALAVYLVKKSKKEDHDASS